VHITTVSEFLEYFESIRGRTRRVVQCIPAERIEWTHAPGRFTLGDLVRHLAATERWMFAENVAGRPSRYPGHAAELASGHDGVIAYLDRMHGEAVAIFASLSDAALQQRCTTPSGIALPTWKWLRAMVEHEVHHRGQMYLMLGMLDVSTPPLYGMTSEEVRSRSVS
jgi:uncharacterized damage-inducible protein DinB